MIPNLLGWLCCLLFDVHKYSYLPDPKLGLEFLTCKYCGRENGCRHWDSSHLYPKGDSN